MNHTSPTASHPTHLAKMYFAEETVVQGRTLIGKQYALIDGVVSLQHIYRLSNDPSKETFDAFCPCYERHNWMALRAAIPSERWEALQMCGAIPSNM
jgi:hypothetical protein